MARTETTLHLQLPVGTAADVLPRELRVGSAVLKLGEAYAVESPLHGGDARRRIEASWVKGRTEGRAHVEIRPSSKLSSDLVLAIESPKRLWMRQGLRSIARLFARAIRYEIETRAADEADGFEVRRTTPELVRARTA
jgi:hypothetical protein